MIITWNVYEYSKILNCLQEKQLNNLAFKIPDRTNYFLLVDRFYDIILGDEEIFDFRTSFNNLQNISLSNVVIVVHAHHTKV